MQRSSMLEVAQKLFLSTLSPGGSRAKLTILTFHQVPAAKDTMAPNVASAVDFRKQMSWLDAFCNVLALPDAASRLANGTLPPRAAAITFDDGYENNLSVAAPVLLELKLPATFFITSGAVEQGIMWNDVVTEAFRFADGEISLPKEIGLETTIVRNDDDRRRACQSTIDKIKYRPLDDRWVLSHAVFDSLRTGVPPRLMMTPEQVGDLASHGFDIGAHTVNHAILKDLSAEDSYSEIAESRDWVANAIGTSPISFAYPNGRPNVDFSIREQEFVEALGFDVAVSTRWAAARANDSRFALPRATPWERSKNAYWMRLCKTAAR